MNNLQIVYNICRKYYLDRCEKHYKLQRPYIYNHILQISKADYNHDSAYSQ